MSVRNQPNSILGSESAVLLGCFETEKIEVLGRVGDSASEMEKVSERKRVRKEVMSTHR